MPLCPGCERYVSYDRLAHHQRRCDGIWAADEERDTPRSGLEGRLHALECALENRLRRIEAEVERLRPEHGQGERLRRTNRRE